MRLKVVRKIREAPLWRMRNLIEYAVNVRAVFATKGKTDIKWATSWMTLKDTLMYNKHSMFNDRKPSFKIWSTRSSVRSRRLMIGGDRDSHQRRPHDCTTRTVHSSVFVQVQNNHTTRTVQVQSTKQSSRVYMTLRTVLVASWSLREQREPPSSPKSPEASWRGWWPM